MSWPAADYKRLIEDPSWDSKLLRELGLVPNVIDLVGDCSEASLLDVGTGTGWLFTHVRPRHACACDLVAPQNLPEFVTFRECDLHSLPYPDSEFDVVVASLVLMFCRDSRRVCEEMRRVSRPGALLVVSLVHPYFYRTGTVDQKGDFVLSQPLAAPLEKDVMIGGRMEAVPYYYRPLPDYINTALATGWELEHIRDWFLDLDAYGSACRDVKSNLKRTGKVPLYTFFSCRAKDT